jgi:CubicO group peptidase (beta-lactamase class C family)
METMTYAIDRIKALLDEGVRNKVSPGAVGVLDPDQPGVKMQPDTIVDAASLTKILAVWSSIGALWEDSVLDLDAPLGAVTTRQLLTQAVSVPLRA